MTRDQRKTSRFKPKKNAFASLGSHLNQVGKIIDISLDGLSFEFFSNEKAVVHTSHVDIFTLDGKYTLSGIPCSLVYQSAAPVPGVKEDSENGFMVRRCGLKYKGLKSEQWGNMAEFIKNHTLMEQTPPSPGDDAGDHKK